MPYKKSHRINIYISTTENGYENIKEYSKVTMEYNDEPNDMGKHLPTDESKERLLNSLSQIYETNRENINVHYASDWPYFEEGIESFPRYVVIKDNNLYFWKYAEKRNKLIDKIIK